jgi:hypothetical protein
MGSGLLSADGSLGTYPNGKFFAPRAQITLRSDDLPLLDEIARRTQVGRVYRCSGRSGRAPPAAWLVRRSDHLIALVEILDDAPPRGRRGFEYEVWRQAVLVYGNSVGKAYRRRRLAELRGQLAQLRRYSN